MKLVTYSLATQTFPPGIDGAGFFAQLDKALDYVQRASGGRVRFVEKWKYPAETGAPWKHIAIGFDSYDLTDPPKQGDYRVRNGTQSISFNVAIKWGTRWYHVFRNPIYPVIVHELGHALGLRHNDDWNSVMHKVSSADQFTDPDIVALQHLLA